jgi:hypothetical protein
MNVERITRGAKMEIRIKAEKKKALVQHLDDLKVLGVITEENKNVCVEDLITSILLDYIDGAEFSETKKKAEQQRIVNKATAEQKKKAEKEEAKKEATKAKIEAEKKKAEKANEKIKELEKELEAEEKTEAKAEE